MTPEQVNDFLENCTDEQAKRFCENVVELVGWATKCRLDEDVQYAGANVVKTVLRQDVPEKYWHYHHHRGCGTDFRGCHPTNCPKDQYERTGIWNPDLVKQ